MTAHGVVDSGSSRTGTAESRSRHRENYEGESGLVSAADHDASERRFAALDGLRAIAILWVIVHNTGSPAEGPSGIALKLWIVVSNAGWAGVQLFFALSGFLITTILLDGKGGDHWLRSFYARRLLRIVPLYYLFLVAMLFIVPHVPALHLLTTPGHRTTFWYWSYLSNWIAPFGGLVAYTPQVWSLAVEEQFYLAWPFVIASLGERALARTCVAMVVSAFFTRALLHAAWPSQIGSDAAYEFTIARWDTIALGALVALAVRHEWIEYRLRKHLLGISISVTSLLLAATVLQRGLPPRGLVAELVNQPLTGMCSALLVFICVARPSPAPKVTKLQHAVRSALSARWLAIIGKYSYAIYLFHTPVHRVIQPYALPWLIAGGPGYRFVAYFAYCTLVLGLSLSLALLTWNLVEQPFLSLKRHFPMPPSPQRTIGQNVVVRV